ncbi:MAG: methionine biosynthesis protein MetW [Hyphomonadaceae bacterium]|nr:methionine biosynthesis protein MetW [Hyphomonadaceae bacterium]
MAAQLELVQGAPLDLDGRAARGDHEVIARMVSDGAKVLDIGCGDGALIQLLTRECKARARGLERDKAAVRGCVVRGLSVVQGDAETDLAEFPSGAFDFVIFSHTLPRLSRPRDALRQAGRIGERVIVSVRNAAYMRTRYRLALSGRTPAAQTWADGELERRCSIRDFANLACDMRFHIESAVPLTQGRPGAPFAKTLWRANLFAEEAVFLLAP